MRNPQKPRNSLVSVIVPTRNSEQTIGTCLNSIRKQTYDNIELIVVDNFSSDNTRTIAISYGAQVLVKGPERSSQRNYGALAADGEYLLFIDSDMELTSRVVEDCVRVAQSANVSSLIIPEISVGNNFWAKVKALDRSTIVGDPLFEVARFFSNAFFKQLNGYDEEITGFEDSDIQARIEEANVAVAHSKEWIIHYESSTPIGKQLMKMYYYLNNSRKYVQKHPARARRQLNPIRRSYIKNSRLLAKKPLYSVGLVFFKLCEGMIGLIGLATRSPNAPNPKIVLVSASEVCKDGKTISPI